MFRNLEDHPCFNDRVRHRYGRIHLPVAPSCNIQCQYCSRKYDCVNESRPGVSSVVLSPAQALAYLGRALEQHQNIRVVGIAGPGDPLANADATFETLGVVRDAFPEMLLCLATNGLRLPEFADELARLRVSHVTVTVNAVDPAIGARIYSWVRDRGRMLRHGEGAALLLARQIEGIVKLKAHGIIVKINTIIIPGINDGHAVEVAKEVAALGADIMNCIGIYPVKGSVWEAISAPPKATIDLIRQATEKFLPQMRHCTRCRADAAGLLDQVTGPETMEMLRRFAGDQSLARDRPYIAVASMEGVLVNQHLGEATQIWVFGRQDGVIRPVDMRAAPPSGGGRSRWENLAIALRDCQAILVSSAGESPRRVLMEQGIRVIEMEGLVEPALQAIYSGMEFRFLPKRTESRCRSECTGGRTGCG